MRTRRKRYHDGGMVVSMDNDMAPPDDMVADMQDMNENIAVAGGEAREHHPTTTTVKRARIIETTAEAADTQMAMILRNVYERSRRIYRSEVDNWVLVGVPRLTATISLCDWVSSLKLVLCDDVDDPQLRDAAIACHPQSPTYLGGRYASDRQQTPAERIKRCLDAVCCGMDLPKQQIHTDIVSWCHSWTHTYHKYIMLRHSNRMVRILRALQCDNPHMFAYAVAERASFDEFVRLTNMQATVDRTDDHGGYYPPPSSLLDREVLSVTGETGGQLVILVYPCVMPKFAGIYSEMVANLVKAAEPHDEVHTLITRYIPSSLSPLHFINFYNMCADFNNGQPCVECIKPIIAGIVRTDSPAGVHSTVRSWMSRMAAGELTMSAGDFHDILVDNMRVSDVFKCHTCISESVRVRIIERRFMEWCELTPPQLQDLEYYAQIPVLHVRLRAHILANTRTYFDYGALTRLYASIIHVFNDDDMTAMIDMLRAVMTMDMCGSSCGSGCGGDSMSWLQRVCQHVDANIRQLHSERQLLTDLAVRVTDACAYNDDCAAVRMVSEWILAGCVDVCALLDDSKATILYPIIDALLQCMPANARRHHHQKIMLRLRTEIDCAPRGCVRIAGRLIAYLHEYPQYHDDLVDMVLANTALVCGNDMRTIVDECKSHDHCNIHTCRIVLDWIYSSSTMDAAAPTDIVAKIAFMIDHTIIDPTHAVLRAMFARVTTIQHFTAVLRMLNDRISDIGDNTAVMEFIAATVRRLCVAPAEIASECQCKECKIIAKFLSDDSERTTTFMARTGICTHVDACLAAICDVFGWDVSTTFHGEIVCTHAGPNSTYRLSKLVGPLVYTLRDDYECIWAKLCPMATYNTNTTKHMLATMTKEQQRATRVYYIATIDRTHALHNAAYTIAQQHHMITRSRTQRELSIHKNDEERRADHARVYGSCNVSPSPQHEMAITVQQEINRQIDEYTMNTTTSVIECPQCHCHLAIGDDVSMFQCGGCLQTLNIT